MNKEELIARDEYFKQKNFRITTCRDGKPYVFISYKSDNWRQVFEGCVEGLYFKNNIRFFSDNHFNERVDGWTQQMSENISHHNCQCVLAFISNEYITSYAALLEILTAFREKKKIIFICLYDSIAELSKTPGNGETVEISPDTKKALGKVCEFIEKTVEKDDSPYEKAFRTVALKLRAELDNKSISKDRISSFFWELIRNYGNMHFIRNSILNTVKDASEEGAFPETDEQTENKPNEAVSSANTVDPNQQFKYVPPSKITEKSTLKNLQLYLKSYQSDKRYTLALAMAYLHAARVLANKYSWNSCYAADDIDYVQSDGTMDINPPAFVMMTYYTESSNLFADLAKKSKHCALLRAQIDLEYVEGFVSSDGSDVEYDIVKSDYQDIIDSLEGPTLSELEMKARVYESFMDNIPQYFDWMIEDITDDMKDFVSPLMDVYNILLTLESTDEKKQEIQRKMNDLREFLTEDDEDDEEYYEDDEE